MREKKILPPTYFNISVILIALLYFILPVLEFIYFPWNLSGILFIISGALLNLIADRDFKRAQTTVKPFEYSTVLLTGGVFGISRNPMYLGMSAILLGESLLFGSLSPFIVALIFTLLMHFRFIIAEEKMLEEKFGDDYIVYSDKVRRWI